MTLDRRLVLPLVVVCSWLVVAAAAGAGAPPDPELDAAERMLVARRWAGAESLATVALARAERASPPDAPSVARALELLARGRISRRISSDTLGVSWASRLVSARESGRPRDTLALATAELLLGKLQGMSEDFPPALTHLGRALTLRRSRIPDDDSLIADVRLTIGQFQRRARDLPAAEKTLREATAAYRGRTGPNDLMRGTLELELAGTLTWMGRLDEGRASYLRAIECYRSRLGPNAGELGVVFDGLSQLEKDAGDMGRSLDWLERAVDVKTRAFGADARATLISRANLGSRLIEFGDHTAARRCLEPVVDPLEAIFGRGHSVTEQARTQFAIACLAGGDTTTAMRSLETSLAGLEARPGDHRPELAWSLQWRAATLLAEGRLSEARATNDRALATARGLEGSEAPMLVDLRVQQLGLLGRTGELAGFPEATAALDSLVKEGRLGGTQVDVIARTAETRAALRLGDRGRAWERALESDALARRLTEANAARLADRQALGLSEQWSEALPVLAELALGGAPADPAVAWDRAQLWHGWWERERELRRAPEEESDSAVTGTHLRWVEAERRYARLIVDRAGSPDSAGVRDEVERARVTAERAERLYRTAAAQAGAPAPPSQPSLAEVLTHLGPDEALVSYALASATADDPGRLVAFVSRGGGSPSILDLGAVASTRASVTAWRERLAEPPGPHPAVAERACREAGLTVRKRLWDPLGRWLTGAQRVHVIEGPLGDVPWLALPEGTRAYLAERGPQVAAHESERDVMSPAAAEPAARVLAVGGPDFERPLDSGSEGAPLAALLLRASPDPCTPFPRLGPLPAASSEVSEIAAILSRGGAGVTTRVLTGAEAEEATFKREAPGFTILHLATHGILLSDTCGSVVPGSRGVGGVARLDAGRPKPKRAAPGAVAAEASTPPEPSPWIGRRVWLALAGANHAREATAGDDDGMLTAEEVVTLDLRSVEWVVLSACHSGAVEDWSEEGALGMARAFLLAGARTVVASRWSLEDESAREWMNAFYAARARGVRKGSQALAEACRATLAARRASGRTTHPFYWAAFTASGD